MAAASASSAATGTALQSVGSCGTAAATVPQLLLGDGDSKEDGADMEGFLAGSGDSEVRTALPLAELAQTTSSKPRQPHFQGAGALQQLFGADSRWVEFGAGLGARHPGQISDGKKKQAGAVHSLIHQPPSLHTPRLGLSASCLAGGRQRAGRLRRWAQPRS